NIGLAFSPADYFWVSLLGLATVTSLLGNDFLKGLVAALLGLAIGTIGLDISTGDERYTFGLLELTEGLDLVVLLTALFAFPPVIQMVEQALSTGLPRHLLRLKSQGSVLSQWRQFLPVWLRSSFIGIVIGILPGAGGSMSCYLAYNDAKRRDADPDS
ncbi:C4-dicarboxylate ABC transporter permease, partial [Pectobacterium polonicum]